MKNTILIILSLFLPIYVAANTVYVDAIKNTLGPNGGTYLHTKVKSNVYYELEVIDNSAIFNTGDNARIENVGVMYVEPPRKMTIATINTNKTCVITESNLYFFFVDDARLNTGGANIEITEVDSCEPNTDNSTAVGIAQCQSDPTSCGITALTLIEQPINISDVDTSPLETNSKHLSYFLLQISSAFSNDVSINYTTSDVTAIAGQDYLPTTGIATIEAGKTSTTIGVEIIGDFLNENDEVFDLVISNPQGAKFPIGIEKIRAHKTIVDDD